MSKVQEKYDPEQIIAIVSNPKTGGDCGDGAKAHLPSDNESRANGYMA